MPKNDSATPGQPKQDTVAMLVASLRKLRNDIVYTAPELMSFKAQEKWIPLIDDAIAAARGDA